MNNFYLFAMAMIIPFVVIRTAFLIIPHYLGMMHPTTKRGLRFHHFHYGIFVLLAGILVLLINGLTTLVIWMLGIGAGLVLDELVASLLIPETEPQDTKIYSLTLFPTLVIFILMVAIIFGISRIN